MRLEERKSEKKMCPAPGQCILKVYRNYLWGDCLMVYIIKYIVKYKSLNSRSSNSVDSRWNLEKLFQEHFTSYFDIGEHCLGPL